MNVQQPSIAARILTVISTAPDLVNTTQIYALVDEAESVQLVSVTCRDLLNAGKVQREQRNGRWHYGPRQLDLLPSAPEPAAAAELRRAVGVTPAKRSRAQTLCGRRADRGVDRNLKLRTLDRLIELLANDIATVLRAVRKDVESLA